MGKGSGGIAVKRADRLIAKLEPSLSEQTVSQVQIRCDALHGVAGFAPTAPLRFNTGQGRRENSYGAGLESN
jgi:hypothetical protein